MDREDREDREDKLFARLALRVSAATPELLPQSLAQARDLKSLMR